MRFDSLSHGSALYLIPLVDRRCFHFKSTETCVIIIALKCNKQFIFLLLFHSIIAIIIIIFGFRYVFAGIRTNALMQHTFHINWIIKLHSAIIVANRANSEPKRIKSYTSSSPFTTITIHMCLSENGIIKTSIDYRRIANSKSNNKYAFDSDIRLIYAEWIPCHLCFFFQTCRARRVYEAKIYFVLLFLPVFFFCFRELMIFPWKRLWLCNSIETVFFLFVRFWINKVSHPWHCYMIVSL